MADAVYRPADDAYWVPNWSSLLFTGDLFAAIPFVDQPSETLVDGTGQGKHVLGPIAFGYGLLISPTCDMVDQKTLAISHPDRVFVPVLPREPNGRRATWSDVGVRSSVSAMPVTRSLTRARQTRQTPRIVVFSIRRRESACDECGRELFHGNLIHLDERRVVRCLECADLGHLVYLPAGNMALTRRATAHSKLTAVVVRWSTARRRYERQGTLVEEEALERAEAECLSDADQREARRLRATERRDRLDAAYVRDFARAIRERYPGCPAGAEVAIAEHACERYSGRVGRSAAAKALSPEAIDLAMRAHVRHHRTRYDGLLMGGLERDDARAAVRDEVDRILLRWREAVPGRPTGD